MVQFWLMLEETGPKIEKVEDLSSQQAVQAVNAGLADSLNNIVTSASFIDLLVNGKSIQEGPNSQTAKSGLRLWATPHLQAKEIPQEALSIPPLQAAKASAESHLKRIEEEIRKFLGNPEDWENKSREERFSLWEEKTRKALASSGIEQVDKKAYRILADSIEEIETIWTNLTALAEGKSVPPIRPYSPQTYYFDFSQTKFA